MTSLGRSKEDYLKTLYLLSRECDSVHAVDLARSLGITKASVSAVLKKLISDGWVMRSAAPEHVLSLTGKGLQVAESLYERHVFFKEQLIRAGIDEETAEREACELEHAITSDSFEKLKSNIAERPAS